MRAFVAIEVPPATPSGAAHDAAPTHLTLQFLGEVPSDRIDDIARRLRSVGPSIAPFELELDGVGAFPSTRSPRVVWIGVKVGHDEVVELARRVQEALFDRSARAGEAEFVPHVTYFRVRSASDRRAAVELLEGRRPPPPPRTVRVTEFLLKESILGSGGAVHRTLAAFPLEGGPRHDPDTAPTV